MNTYRQMNAAFFVMVCCMALVLGFILGIAFSKEADGLELDTLEIFAQEVCIPGREQVRCQEWIIDCMYQEMTAATDFDFDNSGERCIEQLPRELWPD